MSLSRILIVTLIAIGLVKVNGWWEVGHMLTAQVALLDLTSRNMTIVNEANRIIEALNKLSTNKSQDFVQAASWMDDIKTPATNFWELWHYFDKPLNKDGIYIRYDFLSQQFNSVDTMKRIKNVFSNYSIGEQVTMERAMMLRMMIHVVGDMHQPLHNSNFFNQTFHTAMGDAGGNSINITTPKGVTMNLHAYWDSGAFSLNQDSSFMNRPLNDDQQQYMQNWGRSLIDQYPRSQVADRVNQTDPRDWNTESYMISRDFIYPYLETNNVISQQHQDEAIQIIEKQIVVGGYRLADFMYKALNGQYLHSTSPKLEDEETIQKLQELVSIAQESKQNHINQVPQGFLTKEKLMGNEN